MIDWNNISDEQTSASLFHEIETWRNCALLKAKRHRWAGRVAEASLLEWCAAHYQQAIDALSKLPMPEANDGD